MVVHIPLVTSFRLRGYGNTDFFDFFLSPVLPKFEVTVETKDEVSIGHDEFEAKVCAK